MISEFLDRQAADADLFELEDVTTGEKKQYRIVSKATVTQEGTPLNKATFDPMLDEINGKLDASALLDKVYPVGSIYISTANVNPSTFIGGTWAAYAQGQFLLGAGSGYSAGSTGGAATVTLTTQQIPAHYHRMNRMAWTWTENENPDKRFNSIGPPEYDANQLVGAHGFTYDQLASWGFESVGGGQAHNNMPPYIVCYMWRRTA